MGKTRKCKAGVRFETNVEATIVAHKIRSWILNTNNTSTFFCMEIKC
jgi:hypothetical protein